MTMRKISAAISCSLVPLLFFGGSVLAADVRIDGFASFIGGAVLDDDEGGLMGYSEEDFTFKSDSLYALQIRGDLGDGLSATAQVVGRGSEDFEAGFEWAFVSYEINDEWRISAGKTRVPLYMYSDFLDVGYAYHWISPPQAVYDMPFSTLEGVNVEYLTDIGDWTSRLTLVAGATDDPLNIGGELSTLTLRNAVGASWSMNYDWLTIRGILLTAKTSLENASITGLSSALESMDEAFAAGEAVLAALVGGDALYTVLLGERSDFDLSDHAADVLWEDDRGNYAGLAVSVDLEQFIFVAEYTRVEVADAFLADLTSYYLSAGWRTGDWTTHLTYSVDDDNEKDTEEEVAALIPIHARLQDAGDPGANASIDAGVASLNAGRDELIAGVRSAVTSQEWDTKTWTLGTRWNFHPSAAFKAEYTVSDRKKLNRKPKIINFGVDLVF